MNGPYLILHKVRGEPAFDIAEHVGEDSDGELWIIPTSGHRAFPYQTWPLEELVDTSDINNDGYHERPYDLARRLPSEWQDHYSCNDRPLKEDLYVVKERAAGLLSKLGLVKPVVVTRRI